MKKFLANLGSRKFLIALVSIISGILTMATCDDNLIQFICSLVMIIVPALTYIITEGALDYKSIGVMLEDVAEIINRYIEQTKEKEPDIEINEGDTETEGTNEIDNIDSTELKEGTIEITKEAIVISE